MGTSAYMSPEQAQGMTLDARSDVFSFGRVLYEMLSGARAFQGTSMAKRPADRFQTIAEVRAALEKALAKPADTQPSIAVLPFANRSRDADDEYCSDGLAEEIINLLVHVPGLKVTARSSAFAFRGVEQDITKIAAALAGALQLKLSIAAPARRMPNMAAYEAYLKYRAIYPRGILEEQGMPGAGPGAGSAIRASLRGVGGFPFGVVHVWRDIVPGIDAAGAPTRPARARTRSRSHRSARHVGARGSDGIRLAGGDAAIPYGDGSPARHPPHVRAWYAGFYLGAGSQGTNGERTAGRSLLPDVALHELHSTAVSWVGSGRQGGGTALLRDHLDYDPSV